MPAFGMLLADFATLRWNNHNIAIHIDQLLYVFYHFWTELALVFLKAHEDVLTKIPAARDSQLQGKAVSYGVHVVDASEGVLFTCKIKSISRFDFFIS